jgi:predicted transcriptional regulator with HTH domain
MAQEGMLPMRNKPSGADVERATTTAEQDDRDQKAVLMQVLFIYPETVALAELVREVTSASPDPAERDGIERAVRDLTGVGLLRLHGDLVTPTRAAVKFHELAEI